MKRWMMVLLMLLVMIGAVVKAQDATAEPLLEGVAVRDLEIDLGDNFVTRAQLTYPTQGEGPFPLVILVHGSGPYDMDATYATALDQPPLSANFRLLAGRLPEAGIAVLRYNKRGVLAYGEYDQSQMQAAFNLDRLIADLNAVVDAALEQPEVDPAQIYLYGWSEGAWVVANLATQREFAGLILQGAANGDLSNVLEFQHLETGIAYLSDVTDANGDGLLSLEEVQSLPPGPVGYMALFYLYDMASTPDEPLINSYVDQDDDGQISIEDELRPMVEQYIENFANFLPRDLEASYDTAALVADLDIPVLMLHGDTDGWTPLAGAQAIAEAAPDAVTLNIYEGLGHALSMSQSLATDAFGVMADAPIEDLIRWIQGE